jgi:putative endonuclease
LLNSPFRFHDKNDEKRGHIEIGEIGEKMARLRLYSNGRKILYCNFRGPNGGEVDIIARDGNTLSFVEVKTRRKRETSRPLDAVNKEKQALIKRGARAWLKLLKDDNILWRFDVVEVELTEGEKPKITVIEGAF